MLFVIYTNLALRNLKRRGFNFHIYCIHCELWNLQRIHDFNGF